MKNYMSKLDKYLDKYNVRQEGNVFYIESTMKLTEEDSKVVDEVKTKTVQVGKKKWHYTSYAVPSINYGTEEHPKWSWSLSADVYNGKDTQFTVAHFSRVFKSKEESEINRDNFDVGELVKFHISTEKGARNDKTT